jgi:type IV pilus assembly protein PilM
MARRTYGLDIGSHSVKLVELAKDSTGVKLSNCAVKEIYSPDQEFDLEGPPPRQVAAAVKEAFREMRVSPRRARSVNASLGGPYVSVKQVRTIPLAPEEMDSSLAFEARKHLPLDESEAILDFQILSGDLESTHMEILLVATTQKVFSSFVNMMKDLGIKPRVIDAESLALLNSYLLTHEVKPGEICIFLEVGARSSILTFYGPTDLFFTRDIAFGGHHFTEDVRARRDLEYGEADRFKKQNGIFLEVSSAETGEGPSGLSIKVARKTAQESLVEEIRRSLRYYTKETGRRDFERIFLAGGSALIAGLDTYLGNELGIPVEVYDPTDRLQLPVGFPRELVPQLAVALGMALRED